MIIKTHKKFKKAYRKLPPKLQIKVLETLEVFEENPHTPALRNHALKGILSPRRAISVTGDIRIIFEEHQDYTVVLMLDVGKHSVVYPN